MTNAAAAHDAARPFERYSALALQTVCDAVNQDKPATPPARECARPSPASRRRSPRPKGS